jgi:NDP-sugar pyrophosphorylase family protein
VGGREKAFLQWQPDLGARIVILDADVCRFIDIGTPESYREARELLAGRRKLA